MSELVAKENRKGQARAPAQRDPKQRDDVAGGTVSGDNVGSALRSAYDQAVNEDIPAEMLDLLGKLS